MIIDCQKLANDLKEDLKIKIEKEVEVRGRSPKLMIIQVGNNQASNAYIKGKVKDCDEVGIKWTHIHIDEDTATTGYLCELIKNMSWEADGIIVQLPLPDHINKDAIIDTIANKKDVDGFKHMSKHMPCTPKGVMTIFEKMGVDLTGKVCCVIGKSDIVGRPLVNLLMTAGATVISCNSKTKDLKSHTLRSDIIISAVGKRDLITKDMVTEDSIVIDVGINRDENGKLCGDVSRDCYDYVKMITPVPKGVGLMTRVSLLQNLYDAFMLSGKPNYVFVDDTGVQ